MPWKPHPFYRDLCLEHLLWRGGGSEQKADLGFVGIYVCCFQVSKEGSSASRLRLHFSPVPRLRGRRGELVWAPSPRSCVLSGVAGCPNQGSMEPHGVAAHEGCWSWSDGQAGLPYSVWDSPVILPCCRINNTSFPSKVSGFRSGILWSPGL